MNKLGDWIVDCASGPFGSNLKVECFVPSGFPVIDGANLKGVVLTDNVTKFVTEDKARSLSRSIAKRHDIVVTISGTLGQVAYIPEDSEYEEYLCSQRQFRVTFDETKVDIKYLTYYLHTSMGQKKILAFANYVGVPALSQPIPNFKNIEVDFPNIEIQHKVANILENIDRKITLNNSICADLEALAKEIYDYWFVQFDFPDENGKPYKSSGGKMVWCEELNREIPEGWKSDKIGNLLGDYPKTVSVLRDNYDKGSQYPIIDQSRDFICGYTDDDTKVLHMKDAIVFGDHTNFAKYINFAFARGADGTQIVNSNNVSLSNYLLYLQICSLPVIEQGYSRHYKFLKEQYVCIPIKSINDMFMQTVNDCLYKHTECIVENKELTKLRDFLLPMLMNGQIKIGA